MNIIISGGSGFLGKETIRAFEDKGHQVSSLVRRLSGLPNEILCDLATASSSFLQECLHPVDAMIHLASVVDFSESLSLDLFKVNTLATNRLARICEKNATKLVFASGIIIHGKAAEKVSKESVENPDLPYSLSKWLGEELILEALENVAILRIGGIFGLNGPAHLGLNQAIRNALENNEVPTLVGEGTARRNYIYVKDLAKWIVRIIENDSSGVFYNAGKEILSMREMLDLISKVFLNSVSCQRKEGKEAKDQICTPSNDIPDMMSFREALEDIKHDYDQQSVLLSKKR